MTTTSSDLVQISIVPEVEYGITPDDPVFYPVRITGEGLSFAPTTTKSNEMNPLRMVTDSILTGGSTTGDLSFEMAHERWLDILLSAAMCNDWDTNELIVGSSLKSFTVEKKIPVPEGVTQYHRFSGCTVNGFSFDIKPNAVITGSFTLLGKTVEISETPLDGATYVSPLLTPVMTAPRVVGIKLDGIPAVSRCFNNLQVTLNNNNRAIECIGTLGAKELALGRAEVTAAFSVLFTTSDLLQTLLDQAETSLEFTTEDTVEAGDPSVNNSYKWFMPRVKFTANPIVASGTGQDVVNNVSAESLLDPTLFTSLQITRSDLIPVPTTPKITSPLAETGSVGSAFSYQITATHSPTSYGATGLPSGLAINTSTGVISGTPTASATTSITISAINGSGTTTKTLVLTVGAAVAPVITSSDTATATPGVAFSYDITATNAPSSYNATGLPTGLSINTSTGHISGTVASAITTTFTVSATNSYGTGSRVVNFTASTAVDTKPKFGLGAANAYTSPQTLLDSMADLAGSSNGGHAGTFALTTTSGNYGWVAVLSSASTSGVHFFDGIGYGGWSGAGLSGANTGASDDPSVSSVTFTDSNSTVWRLFRQDYPNADPSTGNYTLS